ncbi:DUF6236 family protein [Sphingobium yanoikuyae]|uniref:DUF6236 family protein n=1 Tax=Sphingobium yanoikuyae TaxID=13690 RepID=UPI0028A7DBF1|nr:DUF6236 family protein [Sphingobium yanoikuyae]
MSEKFKLPKGTQFDLNSGQWQSPADSSESSRSEPHTQLTLRHDKIFTESINGPDLSTIIAPKLDDGERGAVVWNSINIRRTNRSALEVGGNGAVSAHTLRSALLFCDRLDYPKNSAIIMGDLNPEGLADVGILENSSIEQEGEIPSDYFNKIPFAAFQKHDEIEPGCWTIWRPSDAPPLQGLELGSEISLSLKINKIIVVPEKDVPIDDVLVFRERRRSELLALRYYVEELCLSVAGHGKNSAEFRLAFEKFDLEMNNYLKVFREKNWRKRRVSLDISFNITDAMKSLVANSALAAALMGGPAMTFSAAATVFGASALAGLSVTKPFASIKGTTGSPFDYLVRVENEIL